MGRNRPNAKGGKFNVKGRVSAKNRFSRSRMLFLKKLQNEKRSRDFKKRKARKGKRNGIDVVVEEESKKSKFDLENLQKIELSEKDLELIMKILNEADVKSEMINSMRDEPKKKNDVDETLPTSIATVSVASTKYDFRVESMVRRLVKYGFSPDKVRNAIRNVTQSIEDDSDTPQKIERRVFVSHLLPSPPKDWKLDADIEVLDEEERKEAIDDEVMVLESILGEDKVVRENGKWCITIEDIEIPNHCHKIFPIRQRRRRGSS